MCKGLRNYCQQQGSASDLNKVNTVAGSVAIALVRKKQFGVIVSAKVDDRQNYSKGRFGLGTQFHQKDEGTLYSKSVG